MGEARTRSRREQPRARLGDQHLTPPPFRPPVYVPTPALLSSRSHPFSHPAARPCPVDAYVACGGKADKSGHVKKDTLIKIVKQDFGLTIDIEELIAKIDIDHSGEIEFEEFKDLLS